MNDIDIYFSDNYGKLYEKAENGKNIVWYYEGKEGVVKHQFLIRKIPTSSSSLDLYDIVTPYGYGGPLIIKVNSGYSPAELVSAFEGKFKEYCLENHIVSEFVRFHPIFGNADDFADIYNSECIRKTLGTNLKDFDDPVAGEFSKSCRKNIRKAINNGVSWRVTLNPSKIDSFKEIYFSTMNRNSATQYYYFNDEYFADCIKYFNQNILYVEALYEEKIIAAGLYFVYDKTIHIHLSGTLSEYLYLSPAYILRYAVTLWGKENGYNLIHHGGGRSNADDDSLFLFKKQFAKNTEFDFKIGKKIWDEEKYNMLCELNNINNTEFFPAYRNQT